MDSLTTNWRLINCMTSATSSEYQTNLGPVQSKVFVQDNDEETATMLIFNPVRYQWRSRQQVQGSVLLERRLDATTGTITVLTNASHCSRLCPNASQMIQAPIQSAYVRDHSVWISDKKHLCSVLIL